MNIKSYDELILETVRKLYLKIKEDTTWYKKRLDYYEIFKTI